MRFGHMFGYRSPSLTPALAGASIGDELLFGYHDPHSFPAYTGMIGAPRHRAESRLQCVTRPCDRVGPLAGASDIGWLVCQGPASRSWGWLAQAHTPVFLCSR